MCLCLHAETMYRQSVISVGLNTDYPLMCGKQFQKLSTVFDLFIDLSYYIVYVTHYVLLLLMLSSAESVLAARKLIPYQISMTYPGITTQLWRLHKLWPVTQPTHCSRSIYYTTNSPATLWPPEIRSASDWTRTHRGDFRDEWWQKSVEWCFSVTELRPRPAVALT